MISEQCGTIKMRDVLSPTLWERRLLGISGTQHSAPMESSRVLNGKFI